jgi:hypothetical protein
MDPPTTGNGAAVPPHPLPIASRSVHSVHEMLHPAIESPIPSPTAVLERRQCSRFARQLPGVLIDGDVYHSVWCVDVGYGGVKVVSPQTLDLAEGKRVLVKIKQGARSFQDEFLIVSAKATPEGTALHLAM